MMFTGAGSKVALHNIGCLAERGWRERGEVEDLDGRPALGVNLSGVKGRASGRMHVRDRGVVMTPSVSAGYTFDFATRLKNTSLSI